MSTSILVGSSDCPFSAIRQLLLKHRSSIEARLSRVAYALERRVFDIQRDETKLLVGISTDPVVTFEEQLHEWVQKESEKATLGALIDAFRSQGLNLIADEFRQIFAYNPDLFEDPPKSVTELFGDNEQMVLLTKYPGLTAKRLEDTLEHVKVLKGEEDFANSITAPGMKEDGTVFVVQTDSNVSFILEKLRKYKLKGILLTTEIPSHLQHGTLVSDQLQWSELSLKGQVKVRSALKKLPDISADEWMEALQSFDTDTLYALLNSEDVPLFKQTLPNSPVFYIDRKLIPRNILNSALFKRTSNDIFCFSGITRSKLTGNVNDGSTETSSHVIEQGTIESARFIVLDAEFHFKRICELGQQRPVHLIYVQESKQEPKQEPKLVWQQSVNGIQNIQDLASVSDNAEPEAVFVESALTSANSTVIMSDTPGMGKSTLLLGIGEILSRKERKILFMAFSDVTSLIKTKYSGDLWDVCDVIEEFICPNTISKKLFRKSNVKLDDIMLDGFDEIKEVDHNIAFIFLQRLRKTFKDTVLWLNTRPHLLDVLERELGVFGHNLVPFDDEDQVAFMVKFWSRTSPDSYDLQRLDTFARVCISNLKEKINHDQIDIAGIPLQCLLIGEVYQTDADYNCKKSIKVTRAYTPAISLRSVTELYESLVTTKFEKFTSRYAQRDVSKLDLEKHHVFLGLKTLFGNVNQDLSGSLAQDISLMELLNIGILEASPFSKQPVFIHRTFAEFFVAKYLVKFFEGNCSFNKELLDIYIRDIMSTGSATIVAVPSFDQPKLHSVTITRQEVAIEAAQFKYYVVLFFLDNLLGRVTNGSCPSPLEIPASKENLTMVQRWTEACVYNNLGHLFRSVIYPLIVGLNIFGRVFTDKRLAILALRSPITVAKLVFNDMRFEKILADVKYIDMTLLHLATVRGIYSIVEVLLHVKSFKDALTSKSSTYSDLLHKCVTASTSDGKSIISQKKEIISLFAKHHSWLLTERNMEDRVPLRCRFVHFELAKTLLEKGASVYNCDDIVFFTHEALWYYSVPELTEVIKTVCSTQSKFTYRVINSKDDNLQTLLDKIVGKLEPSIDLLDTLKNNLLNYNYTDDVDRSILNTALSGPDRTRKCVVRWILDNFSFPREHLQDVMFQAIRARRFDAALVILNWCVVNLEDSKIDLNKCNTSNETPLHLLIYSGNGTLEGIELAIALIQHGARLVSTEPCWNIVGDKSRTAKILDKLMEWYCSEKSLEILNVAKSKGHVSQSDCSWLKVKWLIASGPSDHQELAKMYDSLKIVGEATMKMVDSNGNTLLHLAAKHNRFLIFVDLLKTIEFHINTKNQDGHLPIQLLRQGHMIEWYEWAFYKQMDPFILNVKQQSLLELLLVDYGSECERTFNCIFYQNLSRDQRDLILYSTFKHCDLRIAEKVFGLYKRDPEAQKLNMVSVFIENSELTLLDAAIQRRDANLIKYLIDKHNCTMFDRAIAQKALYVGVARQNWRKSEGRQFVESLLKLNIDISSLTNKDGRTALMADEICPNAIQVLCDLGCNINAHSGAGNTALHCAFIHNSSDVLIDQVKTLIANGADVNAVNNKCQTPLHLCANGSFVLLAEHIKQCFILLVKANANLSWKNKNGETPLDNLPHGIKVQLSGVPAQKCFDEIATCVRDTQFGYLLDEPGSSGLSPVDFAKQLFHSHR